MKKLKICYVIPHFYPHIGGVEQAFLDTIVNLKKLHKNIEVRVITSSSGGLNGLHEHLNIPIYSYKWNVVFGQPIVNKKDLKEHIKWADIVHVSVYSPVIPTVSICKKLNKPVVVTAHESLNEKWFWVEENKIKALIFKIYEKITVSVKCDCYHVPSEATKRDLKKNNKKANIKRIYWISDNKLEKDETDKTDFYEAFEIDNKSTTFLYYGRPGQTKGIDIYAEAINKLKDKLTVKELNKVKFCFILSEDPIKGLKKFKTFREDNDLCDLIKLRTDIKRQQMLHFIECTDYVVVPSITEGFGLSAIEACERGAKLIYSSGGSLPEVTYGKCVEFKNRNSEDLANKLYDIIKGKKIFVMKEKKDFSTKTVITEFYNMYVEMLEHKLT